MVTPDTKSLPTMKTGNLSCLSLIEGFVEPLRSTVMPVNVNCPSLGIQTPFPFIIYLAMYLPRAAQATAEPAETSFLVGDSSPFPDMVSNCYLLKPNPPPPEVLLGSKCLLPPSDLRLRLKKHELVYDHLVTYLALVVVPCLP